MKKLTAIVLAITLLIMGTAFAENTELKVRGSGIVSVTADVARVVLGVRETSEDVRDAQAIVNQKINAIYAALIEAGVENKDIGTESLYIYASYDYSNYSEGKVVGYTATNTISVTTTQIDKVGEYIDIAFASGANSLETVVFSSRDNEEAQKEALQLAVQNAYEKAEVIAEAAGMQIVSVKSFDETIENYYMNDSGAKYSNARMEAATVDASTMVQASSLQISASVVVEFELE